MFNNNHFNKFLVKEEEFPFTASAIKEKRINHIFDEIREKLLELETIIDKKSLTKIKKSLILAEIMANSLIVK